MLNSIKVFVEKIRHIPFKDTHMNVKCGGHADCDRINTYMATSMIKT